MKPDPVTFLDLKQSYLELKDELDRSYHRVMDSGWFVRGEEVVAFEEEFARYCDSACCVGVANGLDALRVSLLAMDIGPGHEVIVPANTFIATWLAVSATGAIPVPVDCSAGSLNIDPAAVEDAVSANTRAMVVVHLHGIPADMDALAALASKHDLRLIDDAAQAHGALARGMFPGARCDASCFSFYPGKNLGAFGDAGGIVTDDRSIVERIRRLCNYGSDRKYHHETAGTNSRLDDLQAAFLRVKLSRLDAWNRRRREIADLYLRRLRCGDIGLPALPADCTPAWHLFVIRVERRDALQRHLGLRGVQTQIHYPIAPHLSGAYASLGYTTGAFPHTERACDRVLSLPMGPHLSTDQAERVCDEVLSFFR